jgi:adenylate kinase family enzyme
MSSALERIVVVGTSCSGKTTYARSLAAMLGHPHIELDALHWLPDWVERPNEEFQSLVAAAVAPDRWVVDGNYRTVREVIWPRATCIIWLNYGFPTVLGRAFRRTLRRSLTHEELYSGNRESLRRAFFNRESILLWVITTYRRRQKQFSQLRASNAFNHLQWVEFRKPREAEQFLRHGHTMPSR